MSNDHVKDRLLKAYPSDTAGTWRILGEDPNCDWGGPHSEPELETVTGNYGNVVKYALTLPRFFTWGGGGRIIKVEAVKNVDELHSAKVKELKAARIKLAKELVQVERELKKLGAL
jgi:hypothetical protein